MTRLFFCFLLAQSFLLHHALCNSLLPINSPHQMNPNSFRQLSEGCPTACENQRVCNTDTLRCECRSGYFGAECDVRGSPIMNDETITDTLPPSTWTYFYIILNQENDLTISVEYNSTSINAALKFIETQDQLPPTKSNSYEFTRLPTDKRIWKATVPKDILSAHSNQNLLFAVENLESSPITIKIKPNFASSSMLVIILVIIGGVSIVLNIIGAIYYVKYRLRRQLLASLRPQAERNDLFPAVHMGGGYGNNSVAVRMGWAPNQNQGNERIEIMDLEASLTQEDLNMYFPQTEFQQIESPFGQVDCPICLEEFPVDMLCRQLYCGHIFHTKCIQFWLAKNKACPNCKKTMTRMAIGDYYVQKKNEEKKMLEEEEKRKQEQDANREEEEEKSQNPDQLLPEEFDNILQKNSQIEEENEDNSKDKITLNQAELLASEKSPHPKDDEERGREDSQLFDIEKSHKDESEVAVLDLNQE